MPVSPKKNHPKTSPKNPFIFDLARLWGSSEGTVEKYEIRIKPVFENPGVDAASDLQAELTFIKLKRAVSVIIKNLKVKVKFSCCKCLKNMIKEVIVPQAECEFHDKVERDDQLRDIYYIDTKDKTIDLAETFRQEIILHFPLIPVCSKSCKGLCPVCGKDRNKSICKCLPPSPETYKPFKNLIKLIKK
jgi:uncharacterized protein